AGVPGHPGRRHGTGVVGAVRWDGAVGDHGQVGCERLHGGQATGVLHQHVGGVHECGHRVDETEDVPGLEDDPAQSPGEPRVVAAHHDRGDPAHRVEIGGRLLDVADSPGA